MLESINPFSNKAELPMEMDAGFAHEAMPEGLSDIELLRYEIENPTPEKEAVIDLTTLLVDRQGPELSGDETERIRRMISVGLQEIFDSPGLTPEERDIWQTRIAPQAADEMKEYSGILAAKDTAELNGYAYELPEAWSAASQDFAEISGVELEEPISIVEAETVEDNPEQADAPEDIDEETTAALGGVASSEVVERPVDQQVVEEARATQDSVVEPEVIDAYDKAKEPEAWDEALKNEFTDPGGENLPEAPQDVVDTVFEHDEPEAETIESDSEEVSDSSDDEETEEVPAAA